MLYMFNIECLKICIHTTCLVTSTANRHAYAEDVDGVENSLKAGRIMDRYKRKACNLLKKMPAYEELRSKIHQRHV